MKKSAQKEGGLYAQYKQSRQDREKAIGKKNSTVKTVVSAGATAALEQMDGGSEIYDSCQTARIMAFPAASAADAGGRLYRKKAEEERIKKVQEGRKIGKKAVKDSAVKSAKNAAKDAAKETAKETAKKAAKAAAKAVAGTAAATAGTAIAPGIGTAIGAAAGYAAGVSIDYKDMKATNRSRKLKFFLDKMNAEEQQKDSFAKFIKDLACSRVSMMVKAAAPVIGLLFLGLGLLGAVVAIPVVAVIAVIYNSPFAILSRVSMMVKAAAPVIGLLFLGLGLLGAVVAIPVVAVIAVIYNSPFAILFPSISSGETTQAVLSSYVAEFHREINDELKNHSGYDTSEKIYVDFEGAGTPDNYCDILAVYMVKYGVGDTATDMTDKAKENLKKVFDDMCSYSTGSRTDTDTDEDGDPTVTTVKEVRVVLKTYHDMIPVYGFNEGEQEMLGELMKPEYLAMMGYPTVTTVKEVRVVLKTYHDMIPVYGFNEGEQEMLGELMKPEYLAMMGYAGGGDPGESMVLYHNS